MRGDFADLIKPSIVKLKEMNSLKELDLLIRYTLGVMNKKFNMNIEVE